MLQKLIICLLMSSYLCASSENRWESYREECLKTHQKIPGWCKREKAEKLMNFIHDKRPHTCIEIGVYAGSSVYPIAQALKYVKRGKLYAVDPWNKDESLKFETEEANILCWSSINYEKVYAKFLKMLKKNQLNRYCKVLRTTGTEAFKRFRDGSVDFIHIDGNHNEEACMQDVLLSLKKLRKGGFLLFDDANWHQTKKAVTYLHEHCTLEKKYSVGDECLLFIKN